MMLTIFKKSVTQPHGYLQINEIKFFKYSKINLDSFKIFNLKKIKSLNFSSNLNVVILLRFNIIIKYLRNNLATLKYS